MTGLQAVIDGRIRESTREGMREYNRQAKTPHLSRGRRREAELAAGSLRCRMSLGASRVQKGVELADGQDCAPTEASQPTEGAADADDEVLIPASMQES